MIDAPSFFKNLPKDGPRVFLARDLLHAMLIDRVNDNHPGSRAETMALFHALAQPAQDGKPARMG